MKKWRDQYRRDRLDTILANAFVAFMALAFVIVYIFFFLDVVDAKENDYSDGGYVVEATAYYDERNQGVGATGQVLVEGLTVAGRIEDLGKTVCIYEVNDDGSRGDLIEIGEFRDTGYGQATGQGSSKILKGKTIGTIEDGECIDLYFDSRDACIEWGRRQVYIVIQDAKG